MAELADAQDLKSCDQEWSCRFDPDYRHERMKPIVSSFCAI